MPDDPRHRGAGKRDPRHDGLGRTGGGEPSGPEPIPWHVSQPGIIGRAARPTDQGVIDIAITFQMLGADKVSRMDFGFRR